MKRPKILLLIVAFLCFGSGGTTKANIISENRNHEGDAFCVGTFVTTYCVARALTDNQPLSVAIGAASVLAIANKITQPSIALISTAMILTTLADPPPQNTLELTVASGSSNITYPRAHNTTLNVSPSACNISPESSFLPVVGLAILAPCLYLLYKN